MHIFATAAATFDDLPVAVDLRQSPGEVAVLSFTDSDLGGLAAAWAQEPEAVPTLRLAPLRELRHPMSVDLWIEQVGRHARVIVVRLLGGMDWWRYGCERLADLARRQGIALALLPGEDRDDERLAPASTLPTGELAALLGYFREGGPDNMRALLRRLARLTGRQLAVAEPTPLPRAGFYGASEGSLTVPILFYRSMLLAGDVAPIEALCAALARRGLTPVPIYVTSLKEPCSAAFVAEQLARLDPVAILTATAFAAGDDAPFGAGGAPVLQVVLATTRRDAWAASPRGLAPADLAMHVVMPELDGRVLAGAVAFKAEAAPLQALAFRGLVNAPEPDRVEQVAERVLALAMLRATPPAQRRLALLLPDYPKTAGRAGYAVGLDVPASALAILEDLRDAGYSVEAIPASSRALLDGLKLEQGELALDRYERWLAELPTEAVARVTANWGEPAQDACLRDGVFRFRAVRAGNVTVALAPDRGNALDRRADYHDPALPPRHALLAFGLWLRRGQGVHALIHLGAYGTLEWLPGKSVALTSGCFPELIAGPLPVIYPFIVSNPGEAAQAKRRIAAVTLGHLAPPLTQAGLDGDARELERLVDEYAQADGLDRRRRERLALLIVERATDSGLAAEAGVEDEADPDEALRRIDAWLCDLKDLAIKDGLHVYGRSPEGEGDPLRLTSAEAERSALLTALDGRHVPPGPSGAPARGRRDVLPTGRNLFTADPRTMPTATAFDLGRLAADEVVRHYLQEQGDWPRSLVIDLWGSASLRTGGEEMAQGLALMGCRPHWDEATGRVTGVEVLPAEALGRPRVDVTWRISGLFRDLFPTQIALLDRAARVVAGRDEPATFNGIAAEARERGAVPPRIFGTAPGAYGAGVEDLLASGMWQTREELGRAYLAAASHSFDAAAVDGRAQPGAFAGRVAAADAILHSGDDPGRDLLEGSADVGFLGGFAAAAEALGCGPALVALDTTDPARPRARNLDKALARVVKGRAINPRFIAGQMRHGPRGAAELAETVDRLVAFAETTDAVPSALIDSVHAAYVGDEEVRAFLLRESPDAARAIAQRLGDARRRGLWHPRRNDVDHDLATLLAEAAT
jgi:cobaltochelatase CobN